MMEEQTGAQLLNPPKAFINLGNKPTSFYKNQKQMFVSLSNLSVSCFDIQKTNFTQFSHNMHGKRINCIRQKSNVIITGSKDFSVKLWDRSSGKPIHTFMKPGAQFNCLDLSEHILCGAHGSKLVFWDLRKMKQRSQFNDSFNGEITCLQFDPIAPTCFMGCSIDGMINKFDLREPNQQQAFLWGTRVLQCPRKLQSIKQVTLVETSNHSLLLLEEEAVKKTISINDFQEPKHILNSKLIPGNNSFDVEYFRWNLQKRLVQKFFNDSIVGYVPNVEDSQIFAPLSDKKILYINQKGNVFIQKILKSFSQCKPQQNTQKIKQNYETTKSPNWQKIQEEKPAHDNGFILDRPPSFKSKIKKFKPF